jgi:hypothetical protein
MSKNLKNYLASLKVQNIDQLVEALLADDDRPEDVQTCLRAAQEYSKPFLEADFNAKMNDERKTWKGKYFKDAAQKVNKIFGNKLTSAELEDVMKDPENDGKTFDAVVDAIREKVSIKTGTSETELQKMLDAANGKISEYEQKLIDTEKKYKEDFDNYVKTGKLTATLQTKLVKILQGVTSMPAEKAAKLLMDPLTKKALIKLNDSEDIELFDLTNPETKLRKSETEFQTLENVVKELAEEYELPKIASGGAASGGVGNPPPALPAQPIHTQPNALEGANKLAEAFVNASVV